jgi:acetyl esterase/lipase
MTHRLTTVFKAVAVLIASTRLATAEPAVRPSKIELSYGNHPRQSLDLYRAPIATDNAASPVVIYFHGGGFNHGDKGTVSTALIRRMYKYGISVVSANYRFATTDPLPVSMLDGARAVQYLRNVADKYGLAESRIATVGSSAGGGIALYVALHDDLAARDSSDLIARQSSRVSCVYGKNAQVSYDPRFWGSIGLSAALNDQFFERLYGSPKQRNGALDLESAYASSSPINFLTADDPPIRLDYSRTAEMHADTPMSVLIHHPFHGIEMKRRCDLQGVECELSFPDQPYTEETAYEFLIRHLTSTLRKDAG